MTIPFDRRLLKTNAKEILRRHYGKAVLLYLAIFGITTLLNLPEMLTTFSELLVSFDQLGELTGSSFPLTGLDLTPDSALWDTFQPLITGAGYIFSLACSYLLPAGYARYYLQAREKPASLSNIFYPFKSNFGGILGALISRNLLITAWFLGVYFVLFFLSFILIWFGPSDSDSAIITMMLATIAIACTVPVVKTYQYSMMQYLLAENPTLPLKRVFSLSSALTRGYKWRLFVLDLSFIGWRLLTMLLPFIGAWLLQPYIDATHAEAYVFLKARAISRGDALPEEFMPAAPAVPAAPAAYAVPAGETPAAQLPAKETAALPEESAAAADPIEDTVCEIPDTETADTVDADNPEFESQA